MRQARTDLIEQRDVGADHDASAIDLCKPRIGCSGRPRPPASAGASPRPTIKIQPANMDVEHGLYVVPSRNDTQGRSLQKTTTWHKSEKAPLKDVRGAVGERRLRGFESILAHPAINPMRLGSVLDRPLRREQAPALRCTYAKVPRHKYIRTQKETSDNCRRFLFVLAPTYRPGPLPAKYCRHE